MVLPHPDEPIQVNCAVLTVSDTRVVETDKSGQIVKSRLMSVGHQVVAYALVPDEPERVHDCVRGWVKNSGIDVVLVNGGTGIAPRDTTYEAIASLLTKSLPGFGEIFRMLSYEEIGSRAISSRAIAGVCGSTLIFSMPGSSKAVELAIEKLIIPELIHLVTQIRGSV